MAGQLLQLPAEEYHTDSFNERPSLSASIAKVLLNESPLHAWTAHPRLNPAYEPENRKEFDFGTVCHAMLLEGEAPGTVVVSADSWRTKAAKEERDAAYDAGYTPILEKDMERAEALVAAARMQLEQFDAAPALLADGRAEQVLVWEESGVLCRARLDWLRDDHAAIDDLKTTGRSANPEGWSRALFGLGYDVQAAFYLRGLRAVTGAEAVFRLIVVETEPPYALSVVGMEPGVLDLADAKVDAALKLWADCLERDRWPGYPTQVCYAELPGWEQARWLEREARQGELAQMYPGEMGLGPREPALVAGDDEEGTPF